MPFKDEIKRKQKELQVHLKLGCELASGLFPFLLVFSALISSHLPY